MWVLHHSIQSSRSRCRRAPDLLFDLRTGADYLEIDIDIGSSQIAAGVVRLCGGYAKALVVDISFVIEGKRDDELPEQILGTIQIEPCLLYTSPSPRDKRQSRMPSSA